MDYRELVRVYEELGKTTKRLEKTEIISEFIKKCTPHEIKNVIYLLQGRVFPQWDERKIGMSSKLILKAISSATGSGQQEVEQLWKKEGDLGIVAGILCEKKKQKALFSQKLDIKKVSDNIKKLSELEGEGTVSRKVALVAELLMNASPLEGKYITRTILEELRVGVAQGILRDAIAQAFGFSAEDVENIGNKTADYGEVAELAKAGKLKSAGLIIGRPNKVMLAIRVNNVDEAFEAVGKPAQFEYKLDGFRVVIHKENGKYNLFTRRFEDVTKQFEEVLKYLDKHVKGRSYIIDSEFAGYGHKTGKYLPFQNISQRIKRKYNIQEMAKKFPVEVNIFDILNYEGKDLAELPFSERRVFLKKIVKNEAKKIVLTKAIITDNKKDAEKFYKDALKNGLEGVMIKNLRAAYRPGRYVNGWVKLKPIMETLDLVIVGAEWGEGKRANWLSSFDLACRSSDKDKFLLIGKVGTGFKEKTGISFEKLTSLLKPLVIKEEARHVTLKPKIIIEVAYEEIQKSTNYDSGFALRFPRFLRLRNDKGLAGVSELEYIKKLYKTQ